MRQFPPVPQRQPNKLLAVATSQHNLAIPPILIPIERLGPIRQRKMGMNTKMMEYQKWIG
jgi:hypothetical protein